MELNIIADHIKHNSQSWENISLLYFDTSEFAQGAIQDLIARTLNSFIFKGKDGYLYFSDQFPAEYLDILKPSYSIKDIKEEWESARDILNGVNITSEIPDPDLFEISKNASSIMIVEDDYLTSEMVKHYLSKFCTVIATSNAREAIANYIVHRPKVVFLDIHYQSDTEDGFDVLSNLLSVDKNAFVVMVSADNFPLTILKAFSKGAKGFISKPFHTKDFSNYFTKSFAGKISVSNKAAGKS